MRCVLKHFFFSSRRRHTRCGRDWSSDVCSSDLGFSVAKTTSSVPESIPTRIERSRCWNLAAVAEIDCSIKVGFKDRLVLICCFCGKPKCEKDTNLQKKVYYNIQYFHFRCYFPTAV